MIDPTNITNYNLTDEQLEETILWWVLAAGKNGRRAAQSLESILHYLREAIPPHLADHGLSPFFILRHYRLHLPYSNLINLTALLLENGVGCYNHKARTIYELVNTKLDLRTCTAEDLERIYGIGMKTSRCFIIHSRPNARYAGLDTHILKFLRANGVATPKSTPTAKKYLELEQEFIKLADKSGKTIAELDLEVWNNYSLGLVT